MWVQRGDASCPVTSILLNLAAISPLQPGFRGGSGPVWVGGLGWGQTLLFFEFGGGRSTVATKSTSSSSHLLDAGAPYCRLICALTHHLARILCATDLVCQVASQIQRYSFH